MPTIIRLKYSGLENNYKHGIDENTERSDVTLVKATTELYSTSSVSQLNSILHAIFVERYRLY